MTEHGHRTQLFAERLHAMGLAVTYPGLPGHPDHALMSELLEGGPGARGAWVVARATMRGICGMLRVGRAPADTVAARPVVVDVQR